jgi:hypothetical protein
MTTALAILTNNLGALSGVAGLPKFLRPLNGSHCKGFHFKFECSQGHSFCPGCYRLSGEPGAACCPTCGEKTYFASQPYQESALGN